MHYRAVETVASRGAAGLRGAVGTVGGSKELLIGWWPQRRAECAPLRGRGRDAQGSTANGTRKTTGVPCVLGAEMTRR